MIRDTVAEPIRLATSSPYFSHLSSFILRMCFLSLLLLTILQLLFPLVAHKHFLLVIGAESEIALWQAPQYWPCLSAAMVILAVPNFMLNRP